MIDVFISYKQEEREAVQIIASSLSDLKVSVWFDTKLRAGGSFDEEIAAALNTAKAVLVCWTPAAIASEWVRGEAAQGHESNRYVACFLQPTKLIPPFNLIQTENLCAWAGQPDDPAWLKLLDRIGELVGRPGLSTYHAVMRPGATLAELKAWANAHGADPLADTVWSRIQLIEGEDGAARIVREKAEARTRDERRKALTEKSRRLARERGLRDPVAERRRFAALVGSVAAIALLSIGAIVYFVDAQARDRTLRDEVASTADAREFLTRNSWHPIAQRAREKFAQLDAAAWATASANGSIEAVESYLADARNMPQGAFIPQAEQQLAAAQRIKRVQEALSRLLLYNGPIDGSNTADTQAAIRLFRYRWNLPVSGEVDDALMQRLDVALDVWIHPRLDQLRVVSMEHPTEADYIRIADAYHLEAAAFRAVVETEAGPLGGFGPDGRLIILFEPRIFSRRTGGRYDETHPDISASSFGERRYPRTQAERWAQLEAAYALSPDDALQSASYGLAQILGQNYRSFGFETPGEFVRFLSQSEANHLELIVRFAEANGILDELQRKDWDGFARRYNGAGQVARYGGLLRNAYARASLDIARRYDSVLPDGSRPQAAVIQEGATSTQVAVSPNN